jgi:hypothetical protein
MAQLTAMGIGDRRIADILIARRQFARRTLQEEAEAIYAKLEALDKAS